MSNNDWHEKGELPPVGSKVIVNYLHGSFDYVTNMNGREAKILIHKKNPKGRTCAVFCTLDSDGYEEFHALTAGNFLPLKSDRDLAIEAASTIFINTRSDVLSECLGRLYDAGLLRLPDTTDK